jgi:hypothetical protein
VINAIEWSEVTCELKKFIELPPMSIIVDIVAAGVGLVWVADTDHVIKLGWH